MNEDLIWIIVAVIVVLAVLALLAVLARKKKAQQHEQHQRTHAEELRTQAVHKTPDLHQSKLQAQEAEAQALLARTEAERAEHRAAEANQGMTAEEAQREHMVREADRIDPDVDHRSNDYRPGIDDTQHTDTQYTDTERTETRRTDGTTGNI